VNVRRVGVGNLGVCILCTSVNEEGGWGGREECGFRSSNSTRHTHLDTSVSWTWVDSASLGGDNRCTRVHA
jgi:hypothetical protein